MNIMKMNSKDKLLIAGAAGVVLAAVMIPVCCNSKCPEKRFIDGGREMLSSIPDIAKKYAFSLVKVLLP